MRVKAERGKQGKARSEVTQCSVLLCWPEVSEKHCRDIPDPPQACFLGALDFLGRFARQKLTLKQFILR